jgi:hypothetical protein
VTDLADPLAQLRRFQESGDTNSLMEYVRLIGKDTARYAIALRILTPIFDPLGHGEYPRYHELDHRRLRDYEAEIRFIADCMGDSDNADLSGGAAQLRNLLDLKD